MAALGDLVVNLTADTRRFQSGLGKGRKMLGSFVGGIGRTLGKVSALTGAVAGLAGAGGLGLLIKRGQESTLQIGKLSAQTGEAVGDLSRLAFAAGQLRIDRDDLVGAIEELNIRLGETIRDGTGPAAAAFDKLNLSAERLSRLPVSERIGAIADALNNVRNASERGFLADEIFGGDAFRMMALLRQGSEGIRQLGQEADRLGASLDDVDVAQVRNAARAMGRVKAVLTSAGRFLAVQLAPVIEALANRFLTMGRAGLEAGESTASGSSVAASSVVSLLNVIDGVRAAWQQARVWASKFVAFTLQGLQSVSEAVVNVADAIPGVSAKVTTDFASLIEGAQAQVRRDVEALQELRSRPKLADGFREEFAEIRARARQTADEIRKQMNEDLRMAGTGTGVDAVKELRDTAKSVMQQTRTPLEKFREEVEKLRALKGEGLIDRETFGRAFRDARQELVGKVDQSLADQLRADAAGIPEFFPGSVGLSVDGLDRIPDEVRVELADFQQKAEQLRALRAQGIIDPAEFQRTLARARDETLGSIETTVKDGREDREDREPQFAKALEAGTAEAFSAINQAIAGGRRQDHEKKTARATTETAAAAEELTTLMRRVERNTREKKLKVARI